jgi:hypothetical protein
MAREDQRAHADRTVRDVQKAIADQTLSRMVSGLKVNALSRNQDKRNRAKRKKVNLDYSFGRKNENRLHKPPCITGQKASHTPEQH